MGVKKENNDENNFTLEAPDGGWGYMIVLATVIIYGATIIPMTSFGLVFGNFLQSIGDETTGTTLTNGIFNTVNSFTGLLANGLLNKFSYRMVGFVGAIIFTLGAVGLIFAQNLYQMIIFFGVVQGIGFGLLMPASLSAFNLYFNQKMAVMMSVCQAFMVLLSMTFPQVAAFSMNLLGFRGTLMALAALSALCFPAVAALQPVERHLRKVFMQEPINCTVIPVEMTVVPEETLSTEQTKSPQEEPLMRHHLGASQRSLHSGIYNVRSRKSIVSLGDRFASVTTINEIKDEDFDGGKKKAAIEEDNLSFWQSFIKSMDMSLLKDPKYLNISIGLALCFTSDMAFISIIPLMLGNIGFTAAQIATVMSVFFGCDLVSRILLTLVSSFAKFKSRYLVLCTSVLIVAARIALVANDTYMWKLVTLGTLGFLRCFIQTPLPLVISEEYQDKFSTAYSLFMAVNGVVSLICAPLMSFVKSLTQSDDMVCHVLTSAYVICVMAWCVEMVMFNRKKTQDKIIN
ncbi:unnamed protein product [Ceutorhynchus assimilis]|uniref:Uncharacterized protein n=1 Tax=Ceutorhynchus assimilis TaxID=467358 RepID=A0A9N9QLW6_9CUCU|nr:unnamed protein product [Ceutorhynchus assimilis]